MGMRLEMRQKQEQKQELCMELRTMLPEEFGDYVTLEGGDEDDLELLKESAPFLFLHEACHPLYSDDKVHIPELSLPQETSEGADSECDLPKEHVDQNGNEIGIDSAAAVVGQATGLYSLADIIRGHAAICERVVKRSITTQEVETNIPFIARLDAALRLHLDMVQHPELDGLRIRIADLIAQIKSYVSESIPESLDDYEAVVQAYQEVYRNTRVSGHDKDSSSLRSAQGKERLEDYFASRLLH